MRLDEAAMDAYTDRFDQAALRYETLDRYDVTSDDDGFSRYMAGLSCADDFGAGWRQWLRDRRSEGRRVGRVRVLYRPPTPYLCFEMEWGYIGNVTAGEEIRVLDLPTQPRPAAVLDDEFWLLDEARAAVMTYDSDGRFLHADTAEGNDATPYTAAVRAAWDCAEPFTDWWERHPQYHRAAWLGAATGA